VVNERNSLQTGSGRPGVWKFYRDSLVATSSAISQRKGKTIARRSQLHVRFLALQFFLLDGILAYGEDRVISFSMLLFALLFSFIAIRMEESGERSKLFKRPLNVTTVYGE
jgi:hypothetical protein